MINDEYIEKPMISIICDVMKDKSEEQKTALSDQVSAAWLQKFKTEMEKIKKEEYLQAYFQYTVIIMSDVQVGILSLLSFCDLQKKMSDVLRDIVSEKK